MTRALWLAPFVFAIAVFAPSVRAGDEKVDESATPQLYCVTFVRSGDAASGKLDAAFLNRMKQTHAAKNVLFVTADISSPTSSHQARLMLNALGLTDVWTANAKKPGHVVLVDAEWGTVRATLGAKTTEAEATKAFDAALKPAPEEDGDSEDK